MSQPLPSFGVEPEQMRTPCLIVKVLLATVAAVTAAYYAVASVNDGGLMATNLIAADINCMQATPGFAIFLFLSHWSGA
jgi:hypothetical protein